MRPIPKRETVRAWCCKYLPTGEMAIVIGVSDDCRVLAVHTLVDKVKAKYVSHVPAELMRTEIIIYEDYLQEYVVS